MSNLREFIQEALEEKKLSDAKLQVLTDYSLSLEKENARLKAMLKNVDMNYEECFEEGLVEGNEEEEYIGEYDEEYNEEYNEEAYSGDFLFDDSRQYEDLDPSPILQL